MATTPSSAPASYLGPLLALVLIVAILYVAKPIIVPLALAVLLTFVLTPVVAAFQRYGLRRIPAVLLTVALTFVLFGIVGWIVGLQIRNLARELPTHRKEIDAKIAGLREAGAGPFSDLLQMIREIGKGETRADAATEEPTPQEKVIVTSAHEPTSFEQVANAVGPVLEPIARAGLVVILLIFMLIKREDLRNRVIGLLGHGRLTGTTRVLVDAAHRLSRFLLTQLLINVAFGVCFALGLFFVGVPYAFLWGFLTVLLRFVPYIGSWVAVSFPLVLAFAIAPAWTQPLLVLAVFAGLEAITANIVEPLLFGRGTGVAPIALLIAAAFWTWVWGPIGLVLSTPLTVCLVALGQHVPRLRFFAMLLGDQPALQPYVRYYQRLLARDRQEAKQVAVDYARQHGLEMVYDAVFLPALVLARRDRRQAGITTLDESFIFQVTNDILNQLASSLPPGANRPAAVDAQADGHPAAPPEKPAADLPRAGLILGYPAHHEAEELSLAMLAQLLQADGCQVETLSTRVLPSEVEARVARENPALVFLAILPPGGLVQARYLCRRLRKRFADLPIVVGYWGNERHFDKVLVRVRSAGASYLTTSLLQSRSQIRALLSRAPGVTPQPAAGASLLPPVHGPADDTPAEEGAPT